MTAKQILIVEDEVIIALDIKNILENLGYGISGIARTANEAINIVEEKKPDLILMDIQLEDKSDGIEAAQQIRINNDIPLIFLSSFSDKATLQRAKKAEPYGYILKPFNRNDIQTIIEMALYKHKMESKLKRMMLRHITTLKSIGDAVITTDNYRCVTFMNPVAEKLTGWPQEEALGSDLITLFTIIDEETRSIIDDPVDNVLSRGIVQVNSSILVDRTGNDIYINFNAAPIIGDNGKSSGVVFIFRDITEAKHSELEMKKTLLKLRNAMNSTVEAMALTVETRDPYTAGHQKRVTNLAYAIASEMNLSEDNIDAIKMAGVIHDLGKISIPAEILSKPGKLTPLEFSLIQSHSQVGYDILKTIDFPWPVAQIVYQHHEKMNGSGYPRGLRGEDILIEARVITVADVVEAMASHRPYRASLGIEKSLEEIVVNRGKCYEPAAVDACVKLFKEKDFKL